MNQTEEQKLKLRKEFESHFCSDNARKAKDAERKYMREWESQMVRMDHAMRYFDPQASRGLASTMARTAMVMLEEREKDVEMEGRAILEGHGLDPDKVTRKDLQAIPAYEREPIARAWNELKGIRAKLSGMANDNSFDYIRNLQGKIGDVLEGTRALCAEAMEDPDFSNGHAKEGMRDFLGFVEGVHDYIGSLLGGEKRASAAVEMVSTASRYDRMYSLDGVPSKPVFRRMMESCRSMSKKVWEEAVSNSMYRS